MSRRLLISLVLAGSLILISGCSSTGPVLRGQTPDGPMTVRRLRRQVHEDLEPIRGVARKGLALGGKLALLVGCCWLQATLDELCDPSSGGNDSHHSSGAPAESHRSQASHQDQGHDRRHPDPPFSDRKD
jgi:hypothetical protein